METGVVAHPRGKKHPLLVGWGGPLNFLIARTRLWVFHDDDDDDDGTMTSLHYVSTHDP